MINSCFYLRDLGVPGAVLFTLLTLTFGGLPAAGITQDTKGELIKTEYDQQKDITQISLNPIVLASRKFEELRLSAVAAYQGKVKVRPKEIVLIFLSLSATEMNKYESARKLTFIADGHRIALGETQHSKQAQKGLFMESMMITIPTDVFLRVCWSKEVTMKLGFTEIELSPEHITILRAAASYMTEN
jgi:hypothetical protein